VQLAVKTGKGVNDATALQLADMRVATGIVVLRSTQLYALGIDQTIIYNGSGMALRRWLP